MFSSQILIAFSLFVSFTQCIQIEVVQMSSIEAHKRDIETINSDGFVLSHVFLHHKGMNKVRRYDFQESSEMRRNLIEWENQREKLQTLTRLMVLSYPPESIPVTGYSELTEERQQMYKDIEESMSALNYTGDNLFLGKRDSFGDESSVRI